MNRIIITATTIFAGLHCVAATTWYVTKSGKDTNSGKSESAAFLTIQKAIGSSVGGDVIIVGDGTYSPITSANKSVTIQSKNGASKTIVDGGGTARCATLGTAVSDRNTVLKGFTLQNGRAESNLGGGGSFGGTLINCIIKNNKAGHDTYTNYGDGGGSRGGRLYQCLITGNSMIGDTTAYHSGGGVAESTLYNCVIANNQSLASQCSIAGAYKCTLYNCIIADNRANNYMTVQGCSLENCCLPALDADEKGNTIRNCIIGAPKFLDSQNANYKLLSGSPCIDKGNSAYASESLDFQGKSRIVGVSVDIGAYEWYSGSSGLTLDVDGSGSFNKTWYVAKNGKDTNGGTSEAAAFLTIQKAVDTAAAGDRIIVGDGTYAPISTANKKLRIESKNGASKTIIDGGGNARCATLGSAVTHRNTVLKGFALQKGYLHNSLGGGGSFGGTLINCIVRSNSIAYGDGGGVRGGWLYQCVVTGNSLKYPSNDDKYIRGAGAAEARLINCVVANNSAEGNYHFSVGGAYRCELDNSIVSGNRAYNSTVELSECTAVSSCIPAADATANGNVATACVLGSPMFVDLQNGNYHLLAGSPCIDAGAAAYVKGTTDLDGRTRSVGGTVDIGAYEWYSGASGLSLDVDGTGTYGKTWYVTKSGKDTNAGTSESAAFLTIQKAVDTAAAGDRIIVGDGTYAPISTANKKLRIESKNGASKTIIDGGGNARCATLGSAVTHRNTVLKGFALQKGRAESNLGGGGSFGGTLINCIIKNNKAGHDTYTNYGDGGGARGGWLYQCLITGNSMIGDTTAYHRGGGAAEARLINCVLYGNSALASQCSAGAAYRCELDNCIVHNNSGNTSLQECDIVSSIIPSDEVSNFGNNSYRCLTTDPLFVSSSDFRLQKGSACIDAGETAYALGAKDYYGGARVRNIVIDIGAYEYQPSSPSVKNVLATSRHPWNGMVDVSCTIVGDAGVMYDASFTAKDLVGNTNLTLKTLYKSDGTAANVAKEHLLPGTYNWVWDATADLGEDTVLDRVTISIKAQ